MNKMECLNFYYGELFEKKKCFVIMYSFNKHFHTYFNNLLWYILLVVNPRKLKIHVPLSKWWAYVRESTLTLLHTNFLTSRVWEVKKLHFPKTLETQVLYIILGLRVTKSQTRLSNWTELNWTECATWGLLSASVVKNMPANAGDSFDL